MRDLYTNRGPMIAELSPDIDGRCMQRVEAKKGGCLEVHEGQLYTVYTLIIPMPPLKNG